jgi:hypothetical protein
MNLRPLLAAALLAGWISPSVALAAPVSDVDRATARALASEAHDALDRKDFVVAVDRFQRADALVHAPTFLLGVARAQVGLGKWIAAQETYARVVREGVAPGSPAPFFKALDDARAELDALLPRVPYVTIQVKSSVAARVTIDGIEVPAAALGVKRPVDPGDHLVHVEAAGFAAFDRSITAHEARTEALDLDHDLVPVAAAVPTPTITPPIPPPPPQIVAPPPVLPAPEEPRSLRRPLGFVALGVGAAGVATGIVTGILAISRHGALKTACTLPGDRCPPAQQGAIDSYTTMGAVSTVGFVAGAVLAAGGAILIFTAPKSAPGPLAGAWISPTIGPGSAGLHGAF